MWSCITEYDEARENEKLWNEAMAKGLEKGLKKGLSEGRKEGLSEGRKEGLSEGRKEGLSEGRKMEAERMGTLMTKLKSLGRVDNAFRAASDAAYRESLYKEFKL